MNTETPPVRTQGGTAAHRRAQAARHPRLFGALWLAGMTAVAVVDLFLT